MILCWETMNNRENEEYFLFFANIQFSSNIMKVLLFDVLSIIHFFIFSLLFSMINLLLIHRLLNSRDSFNNPTSSDEWKQHSSKLSFVRSISERFWKPKISSYSSGMLCVALRKASESESSFYFLSWKSYIIIKKKLIHFCNLIIIKFFIKK